MLTRDELEVVGLSLKVAFASVAASLSCMKKGAQDSYPFIAEIEEALESFPQAQIC